MPNCAQLTPYRHSNVRLRGDISNPTPFLRVYLVLSRAKTVGKLVNKYEDIYAVRSITRTSMNLPISMLH